MAKTSNHKPIHIFVILLTIVLYLIAAFLTYLATQGQDGFIPGLFTQSTRELADVYYLEIAPSEWMYTALWGISFVWNLLWMIYALTTICRRNKYGYVYLGPKLLHVSFYAILWLNLSCLISWLFIWDREYVGWALFPIMFASFTLYVAIFITHHSLHLNLREVMIYQKADLWCVRILAHNGLAFYAAWLTVATVLNTGQVIAYKTEFGQSTASTTSLVILGVEVLIWFVVENFLLERYFRSTFSVYVVVIAALVGSLYKNWNPENINTVITMGVLGLTILVQVVRICLVIWRHGPRPPIPLRKLEELREQTIALDDISISKSVKAYY